MSSIQTILHPTDFSKNSEYAFRTACSLAKDHKADLVLFHVIPPIVAPIVPEPAPSPLLPADSQECLKWWQFAWPRPSDPNIRVQHRVAEGNAPSEILRLAQALKCDLLVMGTHGRTGLDRLLTGSVAEAVLRKADRLEEGHPATVIVEVAQDTGAGLIIMGTHGRTGLHRLLMGSVAEQVLRKASCPVLTVRTSLRESSAVERKQDRPSLQASK
jgi:nucleotide-binding universal stress UspA family protein